MFQIAPNYFSFLLHSRNLDFPVAIYILAIHTANFSFWKFLNQMMPTELNGEPCVILKTSIANTIAMDSH